MTSNYRTVIKNVSFLVARENEPAPYARTLVTAPAHAAALARQFIPDDAREHFGIFLLDAQNRIVAVHAVSVGTLSASLVHPREVFGPALRMLGVASIILFHNHPSGDPAPSKEDIRLTRQLIEAGKILDIRIHDHVIVGSGTDRFNSMGEGGLM